ncbi:pyridoxamine 5'-phosphate oxidase [Candidatus Uabimicrobium amorphum]|uniref:Pyridoxine/pyridoxamine 5'-phosphate oxidase n=1 Tax=Uabimicrobium amorphum TaxID=2596890 RepID=A0A5S9F7J1_UABAM|nr:pyridoxamine 5'-phosphate oxidase [Candidatus Uabimicrobium amorphum]BBM87312.1 pyridoxine/pyridoxamine 5'-phosphate oxidase [Candidatus Uabimicrobium amorphum]
MENLNNIRKEYGNEGICATNLSDNPFEQFAKWIQEAIDAEIPEANAMALATVGKSMVPAVRIVLLKKYDERGFTFFSNYGSRKAKEMEENGHCSAVFWWGKLNRQVRIEGQVAKISREETVAYFNSRPRGSQISAWASPQSTVIANRELLDENSQSIAEKYTQSVPCPEFWGGYRIVPSLIEFWQGRTNRLHDRICFYKEENSWTTKRLAP